MQGINLYYRNNQNENTEITNNVPQYLFLEPFGKIVLRYYFKKDGLETNNTKLLNQLTDPELLTVKIRNPESSVLSRTTDFRGIPDREGDSMYFEVDFNSGDNYYVDVLYESKTSERLKVKIYANDAETESFENENTVTDGPDEFVKLVDVRAEFDKVYYTYVYRRSGRLKKAPNVIDYSQLVSIAEKRLLIESYPDYSMKLPTLNKALVKEGFLVDYIDDRIYKEEDGRKIDITLQEFADVIQRYVPINEIISLLLTSDYTLTQHKLIKDGEDYLVSCDSVCSYPPANKLNSEDQRNLEDANL